MYIFFLQIFLFATVRQMNETEIMAKRTKRLLALNSISTLKTLRHRATAIQLYAKHTVHHHQCRIIPKNSERNEREKDIKS